MPALETKIQILDSGNYRYNFDRRIYFNRAAKKAFSVEFIDDHDEAELEKCIHEDTGAAEWHFYFNSPLSNSVRHELEGVLG